MMISSYLSKTALSVIIIISLLVIFDNQALCGIPEPYEYLHSESAAHNSSEAVEEIIDEAFIEYKLKDYDAAIKLVEKAIEAEPANPYHYLRLALLYEEKADSKQFHHYADIARNLDSDNTILIWYIAEHYSFNCEKKLELANEALDKNPGIDGHLSQFLYMKSSCLSKLGLEEESKSVYRDYINRFPNNPDAYVALAESLMPITYLANNTFEVDSVQQAHKVVSKALNMGLESPALYKLNGKILEMLGRYDEAIASYKKTGYESAWYYNTVAEIYLNLERYEDALSYFNKAVVAYDQERKPRHLNLYIASKASTLVKLGRVDDAIAIVKERGSDMPDRDIAQVYNEAIEMLESQGKDNEADSLKEERSRR